MICHRLIFICFLSSFQIALACQPPIATPQTTVPLTSGVVSSQLDQQPQRVYLPGNQQAEERSRPLQPISVGIENTNSIADSVQLYSDQSITPYPGYIPPPPASAMSGLPTLQRSSTWDRSNAGPVEASPLAEVGNSVVSSSSLDQAPICPVELRFLSDFIACVSTQSFVPSNQESMSCDFEDGTFCRFQPTSSLFQIGKLPLPSHYATLAELSGRPVIYQPQRNFVYALVQQPPLKEELVVATPITCQQGGGILKFNYWLIGDRLANIKVCTQDSHARSCTKSIIYTETSLVAVEVVHPQAEIFDVELVISNISQPTVFILDNIVYNADICEKPQTDVNNSNADEQNPREPFDEVKDFFDEGTDSGGATGNTNAPIRYHESHHSKRVDGSVERPTACHLLPCTFTNDSCGYRNYQNKTMSLVEWQLGNHRMGSVHTGIHGNEEANGGFLFVGTDSSTLGVTTYILESPEFSMKEDMKLSFDVYRRSKDITLQVCLDTPFNCPYTVSPFDKRVHWKQGETFTIPNGTTKVLTFIDLFCASMSVPQDC
ncbi:MAM domain-containing protein [Trichostrongylus colubriformis]|uniref:MAM domain-containing protein n=1 Tax=Trichostrongylus colubriformis TaxID=6319 RepID=A0AAN8G2H3_TRICO